MNYNHAIKLAHQKWGQNSCWMLSWRCIPVRIRGNNLEQSTKLGYLGYQESFQIAGWYGWYSLPRYAALQISTDNACTLQGLAHIEGWVKSYFNHMMQKIVKPGWYWRRFAGRAVWATPSYSRGQLTPWADHLHWQLPVAQAQAAVRHSSVFIRQAEVAFEAL